MSRRNNPEPGKGAIIASGVGLLLIAAVVVGGIGYWWGHTSVEEGHEVVVKYKGDSQAALTPGEWYWHNPITHGFEKIDMRPQLMEMLHQDSIHVKNSDQLNVPVDVAVTYEVTDSVSFHETWKDHDNARQILIRNPTRDTVYTVGGNMSTEEMTSDEGRLRMKEAIRERLSERFEGEPVKLLTVEMRDVRPPQPYMNEKRKIKEEEQRVQQAELRAEQKVKDAEGEAKSNRIVSESLDENLLDYRQIQAYENASTVYIPVSSETGLPTHLDVGPQQGQQGTNDQNSTQNNNDSGSLTLPVEAEP